MSASFPPTSASTIPAAAYARVSSLMQAQEEKTSLDEQVRACTEFAPGAGLAVDPQCIAKEPFTATTLARPALERLLRQMVQRGVRHLIMDRADRVTREGQVVAAGFLQRLLDYGITLHIAAERLTIADDNTVMTFLTLAFAAHKDNEYRVARIQANRKAAARTLGRYARGNHAPYGWRVVPKDVSERGHAVNFLLVHDDSGEPDAPWHILRRMLRERQAGASYRAIAAGLTRDRVPTPARTAHQREGKYPEVWHPATVHGIITSPMNAGLAYSFKSVLEWMPPDAKHPTRWKRQRQLSVKEAIALPADTVVDPPLTVDEWRWLLEAPTVPAAAATARFPQQAGRQAGEAGAAGIGGRSAAIAAYVARWRDTGESMTPEEEAGLPNATAADFALGAGGLFRHTCGGALRVKLVHRRGIPYAYYACRFHENVAALCPGVSIPVGRLDTLVWDHLRALLLEPGRLEQMAEEQAAAEAAEDGTGGDDPASRARRWQTVRARLLEHAANLAAQIAETPEGFARTTLTATLDAIGPQVEEADDHLAEAQRLAGDAEHRAHVVADVRELVARDAVLLGSIHLAPLWQRLPIQRRVLRSVGFTAIVRQEAGTKRLDVQGRLNLALGQTAAWMSLDETAAVLGDTVAQAQEQEGYPLLADTVPVLREEAAAAVAADADPAGPINGQFRFVPATCSSR